ncbi:predicted protein [Sclerotinia sclerotiorum 1980 UF-70]|uniref:Uncharacterized protein n=1 Tax=Sclerotinia sclerotiorum (strain ATCC 18683 / 1980 / Ss-1) TaxID=665079 RepID=A7EZX7_SCLS1|nr:predicted protein [Sclerotinia sclerotiorum 1980 UF-70]EDN95019.1 predicted protein [Sclerotinia sclerotiorum 1980 UF-70]
MPTRQLIEQSVPSTDDPQRVLASFKLSHHHGHAPQISILTGNTIRSTQPRHRSYMLEGFADFNMVCDYTPSLHVRLMILLLKGDFFRHLWVVWIRMKTPLPSCAREGFDSGTMRPS